MPKPQTDKNYSKSSDIIETRAKHIKRTMYTSQWNGALSIYKRKRSEKFGDWGTVRDTSLFFNSIGL